MKYLKRFNKAIFEGMILEKAVVISDKLLRILKTMNSNIAKDLIAAHEDGSDIVDNSFIDFDEEDGMVSYLPANREVNRDNGEEIADKWTVRGRQKISIGRYVRAMLAKANLAYPDTEIEKFTNEYKAKQKPTRFVLVKDEASVKKYYLVDNYDETYRTVESSLYESCMRHQRSQDYFTLYWYEQTHAKLLVLLNNENDKVVGRAIIWSDVLNENNGQSFTFMDRIYTSDAAFEETFKAYARELGWWYKDRQSGTNLSITDGRQSDVRPLLKVWMPENIEWSRKRMPYMDTFARMGFEFVDRGLIGYLYNDAYDLTNWYAKLRRQDGTIETNRYFNRKKDVHGGRNPIQNFTIIKEYEDYKWVQDDDDDDTLLEANNFEAIYSLVEKGGDRHDEPVLSLGLDFSREEDNGLCIVETAIFNNRYDEYTTFADEIADIIQEKNLLINYNDWDYEANFKIPEHITKPETLEIILNNIHDDYLRESVLILSKSTNKECAEVILKHLPEILNKKITIDVLVILLKYKLISEDLVEDKLKSCNVVDALYENGELWVKFNDYKELLFFYSDSDGSREHGNSRSTAESILDFDWDYGYVDYSLNDVNFSMIDDRRLEQILTIMESDIEDVKSWFEEKEIEWSENWKDTFRESSRKVLWRCIKSNFIDELGNAIRASYETAKETADMNKAYETTVSALESILTINTDGSKRFKFNYEWSIAISSNSIKLLDTIKNCYRYWEDYNIEEPQYAEIDFPYYGWDGDIDAVNFNEELDYRLGEII